MVPKSSVVRVRLPIELLRRRVCGLQVVDFGITVAAPTKVEALLWLGELAFPVMKCKVFNNAL